MTDRPAQRTPNRQLAALIAEAGFSNAGLARRVDQLGLEHGLDLRYDKTSVTRWLRGQQPRGTTPALIAEVFTRRLGRRLSAQDLGLDACAPVYAGLEFAATPEEAVDIVSGLWRKDSGSHAELRKIAFTPAGLVVPSRDWLIGKPDDRVAREPAPRVPAQGRPGVLRTPVGRPRPRGPLERIPGHRVGAGDIAALRSVGELFRTLDDRFGGGHARQALVRYLEHECEPMLRGSYDEGTGRRLFSAAADLTRLAGWTSYDIAAHGLAQRYFVQALRLAQAAGDRPYGSFVLVTMSRQAVYLGHGREAVQLARVAQQGIGTGGPPAVQSLLHAAEARAHGVLGEVRACTAALVRAERALEAARPGDEVPYWARFFDEAQLADELGHCHRDLQQFRAAAQHAERSLQLRAPAYARSRLFCRVVLATARLGLGELDQACALATEAAAQAADMRSARAIEYIRDFERRLEPYKDAAPARTYHEKAAALN
ncbi:regulator [Streptomyces griseofuscus]|uniref:Regulator n=1 Tax=Streptomyces griseofuscus TaxID=146922 RepID=A0A3R8S6A3_9ACTN|nr:MULTISPECIES: regulator [Streptomyces]BBC96445.1 regulator [Streptomyces rochei]MBJ7000758.1 regulator [Streptomyces sp. CRPSP2-6A1]MYQ94152.1 regulator [Streptomyces sp. SID4946]RRQ81076.1 regulator [Streptomyces griseofuscus]RRQ89413.1 regulator [Streptomyces griseofuscus]